jgi:hypothetical protein
MRTELIRIGNSRGVRIPRASRAECFRPALARATFRRNDQTIILNVQLHRVAQPALLDERLCDE